MKKFLEKSHLYFILYYCIFGSFLIYLTNEIPDFYFNEFTENLLFMIFFIVLLFLDVLILINCSKNSLKKVMIYMLIANILFTLGDYLISLPEGFICEVISFGSGPIIGNFIFDPFYQFNSNLLFDVVKICFAVITIVNIILLCFVSKHKQNNKTDEKEF